MWLLEGRIGARNADAMIEMLACKEKQRGQEGGQVCTCKARLLIGAYNATSQVWVPPRAITQEPLCNATLWLAWVADLRKKEEREGRGRGTSYLAFDVNLAESRFPCIFEQGAGLATEEQDVVTLLLKQVLRIIVHDELGSIGI